MSHVTRPPKKKWRNLFNDGFYDPRAAGAVNGTVPVPGPGIIVRSLTDPENKVTIANEALVWAKHLLADVDNSWLVYDDPIARTPGKLCLSKSELTASGQYFITLGANIAEPTPGVGILQFRCQGAAAAMRVIINGLWNSNLTINYPAINNIVYTAMVLRDPGSYFFYKSAAENTWLLLNFDDSGADVTDPIYFSWANIANVGAASAGKLHFLKVAEHPWLPIALAYDTFARADGAIGSTEAAGPDGQTTPIRVWNGATWTISGGLAVNTPALGIELAAGNLTVDDWYQITATQVNHFFAGCAIGDCFRAAGATALDANNKVQQITLVDMFTTFATGTPSVLLSGLVNSVGAGVRAVGYITNLDDPAAPVNFLITYHDGTNLHLEKCVAGTYTSLINAAAPFGLTGEIRIHTRRDGANLKVKLFYRRASIGAEQTIADAGIIDNNIHGMMSTSPDDDQNKFQLFARGEEGEYDIHLNKAVKG